MTDQPLDLAALIRREQDSTGHSYADIARASGLSKAKIGQLADRKMKYQVRADTLRKLATGLRLPYAVVQRAAMVTAGITDPADASTDDRISLILARLEKLPPDVLDTVETMIDAIAARHEGNG